MKNNYKSAEKEIRSVEGLFGKIDVLKGIAKIFPKLQIKDDQESIEKRGR